MKKIVLTSLISCMLGIGMGTWICYNYPDIFFESKHLEFIQKDVDCLIQAGLELDERRRLTYVEWYVMCGIMLERYYNEPLFKNKFYDRLKEMKMGGKDLKGFSYIFNDKSTNSNIYTIQVGIEELMKEH